MHEPVGRVQFVVIEKLTNADLSRIAPEKSCDYLLIIYYPNMTLFSSLVVFFFRVMAHWFGRLPLSCAGVVEVFPGIWFGLLNSPSRTIGFLYSLSISYRSTAIIRTRKISRSLSSPSFLRTQMRKIPREVCSASRLIFFNAQNFQTFGQLFLFCFVFLFLAFSIKL